jgi:hypothetical protein
MRRGLAERSADRSARSCCARIGIPRHLSHIMCGRCHTPVKRRTRSSSSRAAVRGRRRGGRFAAIHCGWHVGLVRRQPTAEDTGPAIRQRVVWRGGRSYDALGLPPGDFDRSPIIVGTTIGRTQSRIIGRSRYEPQVKPKQDQAARPSIRATVIVNRDIRPWVTTEDGTDEVCG